MLLKMYTILQNKQIKEPLHLVKCYSKVMRMQIKSKLLSHVFKLMELDPISLFSQYEYPL